MINRDNSDNSFDILNSNSNECKYYTIETFNSKYNEEKKSLVRVPTRLKKMISMKVE